MEFGRKQQLHRKSLSLKTALLRAQTEQTVALQKKRSQQSLWTLDAFHPASPSWARLPNLTSQTNDLQVEADKPIQPSVLEDDGTNKSSCTPTNNRTIHLAASEHRACRSFPPWQGVVFN